MKKFGVIVSIVIIVVIILVILLFFLVFRICLNFNKDKELHLTPERQAKLIATDMINSFKENDKDRLKILFSKYILEKYNIDLQIDEAFKFIDGKIVSYNEPFGQAAEMMTNGYGGYVYYELKGEIIQIKTDKGKSYNMYFFSYKINEDNKDAVGVYCIMIVSKNEENKNEKIFIGNIDE